MQVTLKYGDTGLPLEIEETPNFQGVLTPSEPPPLSDPQKAVRDAMADPVAGSPLAELARGRRSACIVISDGTRPVPNPILLPPLLDTLLEAGVPREDILVLIATGIHRPSTDEEKKRLVGESIAGDYRVVDHLSKVREDMVEVGRIGGEVPALVNRRYLDADLKILTGFIEPHLWAGYSGGRKSILPGISSVDTLQYMHGPEMVAHPHTVYGMLEGNPFHEAGLEVMEMAGADFILNVTLNTRKEITGVFAGHPVDAHLQGCDFLTRHCVHTLDAPLDFIVTTNAGAPLDCNLYQSVKGMSGAAPVVRSGGDILIAARCPECLGSPEYGQILGLATSPEEFLQRLTDKEFFIPDQWCAQEMYQVIADHEVWLYTEGIEAPEVERYHLHPVTDMNACLQHLLERHGRQARWAVVPDGPMVILKLAGS